MTCKELIKEAAKMYKKNFHTLFWELNIWLFFFCFFSIYMVHDELKDKQFELELSWVGKHTDGKYEEVSKEVYEDALKYAKASLDDDSGSDGE